MILATSGLHSAWAACDDGDTDGDGMPDTWETQYGLDPNDPDDASGDLDRDNLSNLDEFRRQSDPTSPFSGGRVKAAHTYKSQFVDSKVDGLLDAGINVFVVKDDGKLGEGCSFDNNTDYSDPDQYPYHLPRSVLENAELARQKDFMYLEDLYFVHRHFCDENDEECEPSILRDKGAFPVVYADGRVGEDVSPFCGVYWQHLTELAVALAALPAADPDRFRIDGVFFDFELYFRKNGETIRFDSTMGFEDETFRGYVTDRGLSDWNSPPTGEDQRGQRYSWLKQYDRLGDYYSFLSGLIRGFARDMREQVDTVNPGFLIGAYPSPIFWYHPEIFSGWSTADRPAVLWATETAYGGGAESLPADLSSRLLNEGYFDLSDLYPSLSNGSSEIHAYYVGDFIARAYGSFNLAYHLYYASTLTNGYWVWTTYAFTEEFDNLLAKDRVFCFDEETRTFDLCADESDYEAEVLKYYLAMDKAQEELARYLVDPSYESELEEQETYYYEVPPRVPFPSIRVGPLAAPDGETLELGSDESRVRLRGPHNFVIYAVRDQEVRIDINSLVVGNREINDGLTWVVSASDGTVLAEDRVVSTTDPGTGASISFASPATAAFLLQVNPVSNVFTVLRTNVPIALYADDEIHVMGRSSRHAYDLYLWVHDEPADFGTRFKGQNLEEGVRATVFKPVSGGYENTAEGQAPENETAFSLDVAVPQEARNAIWRVQLSKPTDRAFEDAFIRFDERIAPFFGLTDIPQKVLVGDPATRPVDGSMTLWE